MRWCPRVLTSEPGLLRSRHGMMALHQTGQLRHASHCNHTSDPSDEGLRQDHPATCAELSWLPPGGPPQLPPEQRAASRQRYIPSTPATDGRAKGNEKTSPSVPNANTLRCPEKCQPSWTTPAPPQGVASKDAWSSRLPTSDRILPSAGPSTCTGHRGRCQNISICLAWWGLFRETLTVRL